MARFTAVPIASSLHDDAALDVIVRRLTPALATAGGEIGPAPGDESVISLPLVLTGGTEARIVEWWADGGGSPAVILAHPDQNSLPAALEALARIHQLGGRGRIVYLSSEGARAELEAAVAGVEARRAMRGLRLGLVGAPSDWLVASSPAAATVAEVWGPTVVRIPVERLIEAGSGTGVTDSPMWEGATSVAVEPRRLAPAAAVHRALRDLVAEERLAAVSVRCFDLIGALDTTGCLALSRLNDDGIVAGCEGDLPSTIALVWVRHLVGEAAWMANPARVDRSQGTILLAHCTVPRRLVVDYSLDSHFESGRGIGIAGSIAAGPYTLIRIGGAGLDRLWLAEGTVIATPSEPDAGLCRTQVEVEVGAAKVDELLTEPLGNHIVMVRGHHAAVLEEWHRLYV